MRSILFNTTCITFISLLTFSTASAQSGWNQIKSGTSENLESIHFTYDGIGYVVGANGIILKSQNGGINWLRLTSPTSIILNDVSVFDNDVAVAVGEAGTIIRTDNGGSSWSFIPSVVTDDLLSVSFIDSFGICGARSQTILYSSDSGLTWNIAQSGFFGGGFWGASMISPQIGFVAGENSIFQPLLGKTTDSGQNWDFTAFYLNNNEGRATGVDFTDVFIGYVSSRVWDGRGAISKTTNRGIAWITTFFNNPIWGIDFPISDASLTGYAVGDSGVILKTYDAGDKWQAQNSKTNLKLNKVYFIDIDFGFVVGDNGLILRTTNGGEPITDNDDNSMPVYDFKLFQNYPNPFNPITNIEFRIANFGFVSLKVYDVLGNEVATLVDKYLPAGNYEVEFNSHSDEGRNLASGIYFYQLKAGHFVDTKKMLLLQ